MIVEGPTIHEDLREVVQGGRCETHLEAVHKKKTIDLAAIGSRPNNLLLAFLKCHKVIQSDCKDYIKAYTKCHGSVMGTGNYNGQKHCGDELKKWLECATFASTRASK